MCNSDANPSSRSPTTDSSPSSHFENLKNSMNYYLPCLTVATSDDDDHRHLDLHRWPSTSEAVDEIKAIGKISGPTVMTGLLWYSRAMVSMLFLGYLGELELAGGSLAIGFANITGYSVISGLAMGMEPICGQAYGAKQMKLVGLTLQRTVLLLFSVSVPISFLWLNMKSIHYADKMNQSPQWLMCSSYDSRCEEDERRQELESASTYYPLYRRPISTHHNLQAQTVPEVNKKGTNWAVLVGVSHDWNDYRHEADIHHAAHILKRGGIDNSKITVFSSNIIAYHKANPYKGAIFNHENGPNVYPGVPLDYTGKDATTKNLLNFLLGNKNALTGGSGKVVNGGPNDRGFIYITTHGNQKYIDMPNGDRLNHSDLIDALKIMYEKGLFGQLVIYVEACDAGSIFKDRLPKNMNIYATTASNSNEPSFGCYWNSGLDTSLGDTYSVSWMEHCERSDLTKTTLDGQYKEVKERTFREKGSHVMLYGTKEIGSCPLSDFFGSGGTRKSTVTAPHSPESHTSSSKGG